MHAILEYIGVMLSMIVLLAITNCSLMIFARDALHVREEQLYTAAERVMDKILLTTGYPPDWGSGFESYNASLSDYGLARYGSRVPYELDPDKVVRLANLSDLPNPLLVRGESIAELLDLKGKYGFRLTIEPLLKCEVSALEYLRVKGTMVPVKFRVELTNAFGRSIPSALVNVTYLLIGVKPGVGGKETMDVREIIRSVNVTDASGECTLDLSEEVAELTKGDELKGYSRLLSVLIVYANWNQVPTTSVFAGDSEGSPVTGYLIGSYLVLNANLSLIPRAAVLVKDEVLQVLPQSDALIPVEVTELKPADGDAPPAYRVINHGAFRYKVFRLEYLDDQTMYIIAVGQWRGGVIPIVIERIPRISVGYGAEHVAPVNEVTLTRIAYFSGFPYVVKLSMWRVSEG